MDTTNSSGHPSDTLSPLAAATKPKELYQLISAKNWGLSITRILESPEAKNINESSVWTIEEDYGHQRLPIHKACCLKPSRQVIDALIFAYSEGVRSREKFDMLPIHVAVQFGASQDVIEILLEAHPEGASTKDSFGLLPIHLACTEGAAISVVECLLDANPSSVHDKDNKGFTPLKYCQASFHPNKDQIIRLLGENVHRNLSTFITLKKWSRAVSRIKTHPEEASEWVFNNDYDHRRLPIHIACSLKPTDSVINDLIMVFPEGVQMKEKHDMLPIHVAVQFGASVGVIGALLKAFHEGASTKDSFGLLPIHLACTEGAAISVVECLLDANPHSVHDKDNKGITALAYCQASFHPHKNEMCLLLENPRSRHKTNDLFGVNEAEKKEKFVIRIEISAPPGKLGLFMDSCPEGTFVKGIKDTCTIADKLMVGDILTAVDEKDTTGFKTKDVFKLIIERRHNPKRVLKFIRNVPSGSDEMKSTSPIP